MTETIQYRQVVKLEYTLGQGEMKINMEDTDDNYYSKLDKVEINPKVVNLKHLELNKNGVKMQFTAPVLCNVNSGEHYSSMMIGVKFEGEDEDLLVERIDGLARKFGPLWEKSVKKIKDEIQSRKSES